MQNVMQNLTVLRCGSSPRMERVLASLKHSVGAVKTSPACRGGGPAVRPVEGSGSTHLLFAISVDAYGPSEEYTSLLRQIRASDYTGAVAGVLVVGETELDTKALARELIFQLNRRGCAFPERPLVEATGSLRNLRVLQKRLGLAEPEAALEAAARALVQRLLSFDPPRFARPRLLVLHASDRATSNTLSLGELVLEALGPGFAVRTLSLRNGAIEDCRGCSYKVCSHFAARGSCFYGGSIASEVLPAVRDCDALLLLLPNYNDAVGANVMAFINRLTGLHVNNELSGRRLYAVVVSGYSGGDLVAQQALGALCLNKSFLLPPNFCLLETANDPGEILRTPGIRERAAAFAERMAREMLE